MILHVHTKSGSFRIYPEQAEKKDIKFLWPDPVQQASGKRDMKESAHFECFRLWLNSELERLASCILANQETSELGANKGGRPVLMTPASREESHLCPLLRSALLHSSWLCCKNGAVCLLSKHQNALSDLKSALQAELREMFDQEVTSMVILQDLD